MGASSSNISNRGNSGRSVSDSEYSSNDNNNNNNNNFSPLGRSKSTDSNVNNVYNASKGLPNGSLKEHKRFGVVSVKISNITIPTNTNDRNRLNQEGTVGYIVTPRGSILHGSLSPTSNIQKGNQHI